MNGDPSVWQNALPEAIGGGVVALVLMGFERWRDSRKRNESLAKARFAVKTELRTLRQAALLMRDLDRAHHPRPLRGFALAPLVQLAMDGLGKPDLEAGLATILGLVDQCNGLVMTIAIETTGVNRAMGDHDETVSNATAKLRESAVDLILGIDAFDRLVDIQF